MRFVTFAKSAGEPRPGLLLDDERVIDLAAATDAWPASAPESLTQIIAGGEASLAACRELLWRAAANMPGCPLLPLRDLRLLAPIPRPAKNVFCVGSNYRAHVSEASRAQAKEDKAPEHPVFFTKPPTTVIGPGEHIRLDPAVSAKLDYEVELAVIIGKAGRDIPAARAAEHIFGFTIANDISARDLQRRHGGQFLKGKGLDTSCPLGPLVVTLDALPNYQDLAIRLWVNGELRQDGNTGQMIFPISRLIESLSEGMTLEPGDILATGTPSGVGYARNPPLFLADGDRIVCEIEGIGILTNSIEEVSRAAGAA